MSQPSKVFLSLSNDPEMQRAWENARATFRYFWREIAWERRRIVPALDMACVKAPFSDGGQTTQSEDTPEVEHMWFSEVDFDGRFVSGELINEPNWLKTVKQGEPVRVALGEISDWMYVTEGEAFGAHTVNLLRSRMGKKERQEHDDAWGLNFGDPTKIRLMPEPKKGSGFVRNWLGKPQAGSEEHPACIAMAAKLPELLADDPSILSRKDDRGWTALHHDALAGNAAIVKILLDAGADRNARTDKGMSPLQLAKCLGWDNVVKLLENK